MPDSPKMSLTPIQDFYKGQTVFVTGGTGFLGKLVIEKLLRSCPDIERIIVMVRPKKHKSQEERFKEILDNVCFDQIRPQLATLKHKVILVNGDCEKPRLGLSDKDVNLLMDQVSCVIHAAASVRFDGGLRMMVNTNVRSVRDLLQIASGMKKLRAFIYVSTAFSHCPRKEIDEEFYEVNMEPEKLINLTELLEDKYLDAVTPKLLGLWPNTYVYTKAVAEHLIRNQREVSCAVVVRPAVVLSSMREPIVGWVDNMHGIVALILAVALGVLRSINLKTENTAYIVPADCVVNCILAAAWDADRFKKIDNAGKKMATSVKTPKIFNYMGDKNNLMSWGNLIEFCYNHAWTYPTTKIVWYYCFGCTSNKTLHKVRVFFLHTVFAYIADAILFFLGREKLAVKQYRKIDKVMDLLSYFSLSSWTFNNKNVGNLWHQMGTDDQEMFNFDMRNLNWNKYLETSLVGGRIYLLKDPLETLPKAKRKVLLLAIVHYACIVFILWALFKLSLLIFGLFV